MPQPIVFTDDSLARGIEGAGTAIAGGIEKYYTRKREEKKLKSASDIVERFTSGNMDAGSMARMQSELSAAGIPLETSSNLIKAYTPILKDRMLQNSSQAVLSKYGIPGIGAQPIQGGQTQQVPQMDKTQSLPGIGQNIPQQQIGLQQPVSPLQSAQQQQQMQQMAMDQQQALQPQGQQQPPQNYQQVDQQVADQFSQIPSSDLSVLGRDPRYKPFVDWELKRRGEEIKVGVNEAANIREESRKQIHDYIKPYENKSVLSKNVHSLEEAEKLIKTSPNLSLDQTFWTTTMRSLLNGESQVPELLKTEDQKRLYSLMFEFINSKELGGSNPSTREVLLTLNKLANEYKGKETNLEIINRMLNWAKTQKSKANIISEVQKKNRGMLYSDFRDEVENRTEKYFNELNENSEKNRTKTQQVELARSIAPKEGFIWMTDDKGIARQIPKDKVKEAQKHGGELINAK